MNIIEGIVLIAFFMMIGGVLITVTIIDYLSDKNKDDE